MAPLLVSCILNPNIDLQAREGRDIILINLTTRELAKSYGNEAVGKR